MFVIREISGSTPSHEFILSLDKKQVYENTVLVYKAKKGSKVALMNLVNRFMKLVAERYIKYAPDKKCDINSRNYICLGKYAISKKQVDQLSQEFVPEIYLVNVRTDIMDKCVCVYFEYETVDFEVVFNKTLTTNQITDLVIKNEAHYKI